MALDERELAQEEPRPDDEQRRRSLELAGEHPVDEDQRLDDGFVDSLIERGSLEVPRGTADSDAETIVTESYVGPERRHLEPRLPDGQGERRAGFVDQSEHQTETPVEQDSPWYKKTAGRVAAGVGVLAAGAVAVITFAGGGSDSSESETPEQPPAATAAPNPEAETPVDDSSSEAAVQTPESVLDPESVEGVAFAAIEDIFERQHRAIDTGDKELLSSIYAKEPVPGDQQDLNLALIDQIAEDFGTAEYAELYSHRNMNHVSPSSIVAEQNPDGSLTVEYVVMSTGDNQIYRRTDQIYPTTEENWVIFDTTADSLGSLFDQAVCDSLGDEICNQLIAG